MNIGLNAREAPMKSLVTTGWLAEHLSAPDLRIADCTWFLPGELRDASAEYQAAHIPGAVFLNLDETADASHPAPMMLPTPEAFGALMGRLGLGDGCRIILYDNSPHRTAARAWAMFRSFGIAASILDGGLAKWRAEGRPTENGMVTPQQGRLTPQGRGIGIVARGEVHRALAGDTQVVDARTAARFAGEEPEPRPGVVPGHMPGALNLRHTLLYHPDGTWKQGDALRAVFADGGIDIDRPVITTCGSGVTACAVAFALHLLGRDAPVYDGSWAEWGADPATPKVRGH